MNIYFNQIERLVSCMIRPDITGMLLSTQMHGFVLADAQFMPLTPYISWRDSSSLPYLDEIKARLGAQATRPSGVPIKTNLALCSLLARLREGFVIPDSARFCTLGGYIIGRLTGKHLCHITNAAPTGLVDIPNRRWNESLIEKAGLTDLILPRIVDGIEAVGVWQGLPVFPDFGDQQVCAFGAGLPLETGLHISFGTAGLIGVLTDQWGDGAYENRPWFARGIYLRTISGLPGGRLLTTLNQFFVNQAKVFADQPITADTVWQWIDNLRIPSCRDIEQSKSEKQSEWRLLEMTPVEIVACLYDWIADQYTAAARQMGCPIKSIAFSGGAIAKNMALRQVLADRFAVPVTDAVYDVMAGMRLLALNAEASIVN